MCPHFSRTPLQKNSTTSCEKNILHFTYSYISFLCYLVISRITWRTKSMLVHFCSYFKRLEKFAIANHHLQLVSPASCRKGMFVVCVHTNQYFPRIWHKQTVKKKKVAEIICKSKRPTGLQFVRWTQNQFCIPTGIWWAWMLGKTAFPRLYDMILTYKLPNYWNSLRLVWIDEHIIQQNFQSYNLQSTYFSQYLCWTISNQTEQEDGKCFDSKFYQ